MAAKAKTTKAVRKERVVLFDQIRLSAILFMFFAHVVSYFYQGNSPVILFFRDAGNTVCFTLFLIVSGAANYLSYKDSTLKLLPRLRNLLLSYYFLAFLMSIPAFLAQQLPASLLQGLRTILFIDVPGYIEFLIPFLAYGLIVLFLRKPLMWLVRKPLLLILSGIAIFAVGSIAYGILTSSGINPDRFIYRIAAIFVGGEGVYRFPILQYIPVFFLGLFLGRIWEDRRESVTEVKWQDLVLLFLLFILILAYAAGGKDILLQRWPPSIGFLIIGVVWAFIHILFLQKLKFSADKLQEIYRELKFLPWLSRRALPLLVVHTGLLTILTFAGLPRVSGILILVYYLLSIAISAAVIALSEKIVEIGSKVPSGKFWLGLNALLVVLITFMLSAFLVGIPVQGTTPGQTPAEEPAVNIKYWYNAEYFSRLDVKRSATEQLALLQASTQYFEINLGKSLKDKPAGTLVQGVFWNGERYIELQTVLKSEGIYLVAIAPIVRTNSELLMDYSFYLSPANAKSPLVQSMRTIKDLKDQPNSFKLELEVSESTAPIVLNSKRKWHMKGDSFELDFKLPTGISENDRLDLQLLKPDTKIETIPLVWQPGRSYTQNVSLAGKDYGSYQVWLKVTYQDGDEQLQDLRDSLSTIVEIPLEYNTEPSPHKPYTYSASNSLVLNYSAPLYMTWTIDWEGYDLAQNFMNQMVELSNKHNMPMTHYFNPRIYVNPAISADRAKYLTDWVKARAKKGDEIALHLHMHLDLVTAAGLTAKTQPRWGGRTEGHDVLTTAYDYDEFKQIIRWAKAEFAKQGLPVAKGYRAGGWFMDIDNLRVLNDEGFVYDSSGSDYNEPYGVNKQSRSWNLTATTKPYQMSRNNQNTSQPPLMKLWQYPNNGADSTNRKGDELVRRLKINLGPGNNPLTEAQVLTYLTHPHWLNIDKPQLDQLFAESDKYRYDKDAGPIIYLTAIEAHNNYLNSQK